MRDVRYIPSAADAMKCILRNSVHADVDSLLGKIREWGIAPKDNDGSSIDTDRFRTLSSAESTLLAVVMEKRLRRVCTFAGKKGDKGKTNGKRKKQEPPEEDWRTSTVEAEEGGCRLSVCSWDGAASSSDASTGTTSAPQLMESGNDIDYEEDDDWW